MKKIILVFSVILFFVACTNNDGNKQQSKEISNNSEKKSSSKEFSVYDSYQELENLFYKDGWSPNIAYFDTYQSQELWYNKAKTNLIQFFDSIYPNKNLTDEEKVSELIDQMREAVESDKLDGSPGGIASHFCHPLQTSYLRYDAIENTIKLVKKDSSFINEVSAWEKLYNAMEDFIHLFVWTDSGGGSIAISATCASLTDILKDRIHNIENIIKLYEVEHSIRITDYKNARSLFEREINKQIKNCLYRMEKYISGEGSGILTLEDKREAEQNLNEEKIKVLKTLDNWIKQRHICERDNKEITFLTHYLIKDLSTIIIGLDV
ncbi:MAG: hypothetical protein J6P44_08560 [Bacteroidales bacterium]|nr:hypothetical protein [Bacteroidales bacterium]